MYRNWHASEERRRLKIHKQLVECIKKLLSYLCVSKNAPTLKRYSSEL